MWLRCGRAGARPGGEAGEAGHGEAPVRVDQDRHRTKAARAQVSTERADLPAFLVNGGDRSALSDIPGFDQLPGTIAILDYATIVGLNTPSPFSIPYALTKLRPYLDKAAA